MKYYSHKVTELAKTDVRGEPGGLAGLLHRCRDLEAQRGVPGPGQAAGWSPLPWPTSPRGLGSGALCSLGCP